MISSGSFIILHIVSTIFVGLSAMMMLLYSEYENIIIADSPAKIVEVICKIIKEPKEAQRIGRNARKIVEDVYDNKKIIDRLMIFYDEISKTKKDITYIK